MYTPDELHTLHSVSDSSTFSKDTASTESRPWWALLTSSLKTVTNDIFTPFLNATVFHLMNWFYTGSTQKSLAELDWLVHEVILAPDFNTQDLKGFQAAKEAERMDQWKEDPKSSFSSNDGWIKTTVGIKVPADGVKQTSEATSHEYQVPGLYYRHLIEVIKAAFHDPSAEHFHNTPFESYWQPDPATPPKHLFSEVYMSNAFINEHKKLRSQPREEGCQLETVIVSIILWSNSTQLNSFEHALLWLIYLFLGNQSKYTCGKPNSFTAHHLAYIPKVSYIRHYVLLCVNELSWAAR